MMKILLCNNFFYPRGGDCTYMFALAELLKRQGHEVGFFSMHHPANEAYEHDAYFVDFIDYAQMAKSRNPLDAWRVLRRSIYSDRSRKKLRALFDVFSPDIAHLNNIHNHLTPAIVDEFESAKIPTVWTLHDYKLLCPEGTFVSNDDVCEACKGGRFLQCTLRCCKKGSLGASAVASIEAYAHRRKSVTENCGHYISPSRFLKEKFVEFGWTPEKITHIRNFLPELPAPAYGGEGYGAYVGGLLRTKGVTTLLTALAEHKDKPFYIVGEGPERASLEQQASELGLACVTFTGRLEGEKLKQLMRGASYAVLPSEWYENCPYTVMEFMALGKPVIASRIGGLPELLDAGRGILFEPREVEGLAAQIESVTSDVDMAAEVGKAARTYAEQYLSGASYYSALMRVYDGLL